MKISLGSLLVMPAAACAALVFAGSVNAAEALNQASTSEASVPQNTLQLAQATAEGADSLTQVSQYSEEGSTSAGQVTSVSQLSDVQPTDWAFQALQSLVERYGCIAGYPNGTYRGNRAMTRYEFAAGLNACMDRVNELIASATADLVTKEDLATLQKLQEEFQAELATLKGRVDALEARTSQLEAQQFSTTTKLQGEVIFAPTGATGDNQIVFQNRVRLALNTSFTGKDLLVTRLASGNAPRFDLPDTGFDTEGLQTFQLTNSGNDIGLDWLAYYFPIGKKGQVYIPAVGGLHVDYVVTTANPYLEDFGGGSGALSQFGQSNSIYNIGGGTGVGLTFKPNDKIGVNIGYLAGGSDNPASPLERNGVFNGSYAALAQVSFQPLKGRLKLAATYVNSYHGPNTPIFSYGGASPVVGTDIANEPFGTGAAVGANSGGLSASFQISPRIVLSAWGSYTKAGEKGSSREADIWSYAVGAAFPDLFFKGNLGGVIVGAIPYSADAPGVSDSADNNNVPLHVEGFYKFQLNNFISVTPGVIYQMNPGQGDNESVIGTLRTTFKF